ncbi:uncharacterized protein PGTG_01412 [Puccinia graminis f. sp. tritici CRL 75-36-700-3]|uniref:Aldehyde dehydrogenase domain-containing protein n=1 Tax=Puccinia graminis f. sp. tritici (strain CRL 75-36-700-3 / race SCCL) TaxID=418459 RepID=E3JRZ4_PUCGT|nr:uncharacterized protein PGTG_01412 [Puccinia graminis f. sp. tritici CRL 75-36-700-3]EFP74819.1 hypothetical protein PGTG_01412 [Puccinia graminis f. sp. tritici CRL 75-36-700-3]
MNTASLLQFTHPLIKAIRVQLKQLGHLLQENEYLLEEALTIDLGIQNLESHGGKLVGTRNEVLSALKILKKWIKPQSVKTKLTWLIAKPWVYHEPKGIVAIFGAWNYPVVLLFGPLVGAIAGGNSIILKPSENWHVNRSRKILGSSEHLRCQWWPRAKYCKAAKPPLNTSSYI